MSESVSVARQTARVEVSSHGQPERPRTKPTRWSRLLKALGWRLKVSNEIEHLVTINLSPEERERQIRKIVDDTGFNGRIFFVAASGFLASSYSLFSTTVTTPALYFVYPQCGRLAGRAGLVIDQLTLVGTVLGMLIVGHTADLFGRKRLYGWELVIIIVATMGLVQAGEGYMYQDNNKVSQHSMDIYAWIAWWRSLLGFGIGAEYPISSIITVEWASTESRGTMLAWVKSMQSFARLIAVGIGLGALRDMSRRMGLESDSLIEGVDSGDLMAFNRGRLVIDRVMRCVIGIALVPAAIAIVSRLTIPETPRYYVDIVKDLRRAVKKALKVYPKKVAFENPHEVSPVRQDSIEFSHWYKGMYDYLSGNKKARRNLILISFLWGLMDAGFYGMSLDSFAVLATLSTAQRPTDQTSPVDELKRASNAACADSFIWRPKSESTTTNIYQMLDKSAIRSLEIVSLASVAGSLFAILIVNHFRRKRILFVTFLISAVLFAVTGATLLLSKVEHHHTITIVFYAITQFIYNVGPNTLIFIIAAEVFPTVYRGTFYGIAAAGGKIGAIIIRAISGRTGNDKNSLSIRLLACIPLMLLAACLSCYLPDVQKVPQQVDVEKTGTEDNQANRDEDASSGTLPRPKLSSDTQNGNPQIELTNLNGHEATNTAANNADFVRRGSTSSSSASSQVQRRHTNARRFLPRLENITLEDIAPNPRFRMREEPNISNNKKQDKTAPNTGATAKKSKKT